MLFDHALRFGFATLIFGVCAIAVQRMPSSRGDLVQHGLMTAILDFETPRRDSVASAVERIERSAELGACHPAGSLAPIVLRMWMAEEALRIGDLASVDHAFAQAKATARNALNCDVSNPFAIVSLMRISVLQDGPSIYALRLLRLSYRLAPREAWLIVRRAHTAMALLPLFASEDESRLLGDVAALVESGLIREAVGLARMLDAPRQRKLNQQLALLPPPIQIVYQREARRYVIDLGGLSIPPPLDTFR